MRRSFLAIIALLLAARPAAAEEFQLDWNFATQYESRVLGDNDDVIWQVGPTARILGERRRLGYSLQYAPEFEFYGELEQLNGVRHNLSGTATWDIDARNRISLRDSFSHAPRIQTLREDRDDTIAPEDFTVEYRDTTVLRNTFSGTWTSTPWPRIGTSVQLAHYLVDYDDPTLRSQSTDSLTLTTQATYVITNSHSAGLGFRLQNRRFETGVPLEESTTNTYEVFASWAWTIDERTSFSFQMGPAFAEDDLGDPTIPAYGRVARTPGFLADPDTCEQRGSRVRGLTVQEIEALEEALGIDLSAFLLALLDGSCEAIDGQRELTDDEQEALSELTIDIPDELQFGNAENEQNVNLFFALSFQREWDDLDFRTSWVRSNSQTQSLGSATILDAFVTSLAWTPLPRWSFTGRFRFTRRFTDIDRKVLLPLFGGAAEMVDLGGPDLVEAFPVLALIEADQKVEFTDDIYSWEFRVAREFTRQSSVFAAFQYRIQESKTETEFFNQNFETDQFLVRIGFNYRFRPIRF